MVEKIAQKLVTIEEVLSGTRQELASRGGAPKFPIRSLPDLNKKVWGLHKGLTVIGARSSMGKSALALQIARDQAEQGHPVLFLSLEMDVHSMMERLFCQRMKVDNFDLLSGQYNKQQDIRDRWENFSSEMLEMPLMLTCSIGKSFGEVNYMIQEMDPKPEIVIVDYIQGIRQSEKERAELNEYIRNFRELMVMNNCVGILASQLNRQIANNTDRRPELENLKSTGVLEEHSDMVLLLYWNWFYTRKPEEKNKYEIIIAKNRNGRTGKHNLIYTPEWYLFHEEIKGYEEQGSEVAEA